MENLKNKAPKPKIAAKVSSEVKDYSAQAFFKKKAEADAAFLKKAGIPAVTK